MKKQVNLKECFRYRDIWMGVAMLWIVMYHSPSQFTGLLKTIQDYGYAGTDILVFCSGLGCYYSLRKHDELEFYKRRLIRIAPLYWLFLIPWSIYLAIFQEFSLPILWGNIFFVETITGRGGEVNWYMTAMWIYYLLAPLFVKICKMCRKLYWQAAVIILLVLFSVAFWHTDNWLIMVSRLPVFYLGIVLAHYGESEESASAGTIIAIIAAGIAGWILIRFTESMDEMLRWSTGMYWYPFILVVPALCILISLIVLWERKCGSKILSGLYKLLKLVGESTFGIYLVHILFFDTYKTMVRQEMLPDRIRFRLPVIVLALVLGILFDRFGRLISRCIAKKLA